MGAVSGAFAAAATTPLDVIKTSMMCSAASRPTMRSAASHVIANVSAAAPPPGARQSCSTACHCAAGHSSVFPTCSLISICVLTCARDVPDL